LGQFKARLTSRLHELLIAGMLFLLFVIVFDLIDQKIFARWAEVPVLKSWFFKIGYLLLTPAAFYLLRYPIRLGTVPELLLLSIGSYLEVLHWQGNLTLATIWGFGNYTNISCWKRKFTFLICFISKSCYFQMPRLINYFFYRALN